MPPAALRTFALFAPELRQFLANRDLRGLRQMLNLLSPLDLAEGWSELRAEDRLVVFKLLSRRRGVVLFESLSLEDQAALLAALERDRDALAAAKAAGPAEPQQATLPFAGADAVASSAPDGGAPPPEPEPVSHLIRSLSPRTLAQLNRYLSKEGAAHPSMPMPVVTWPEGTVGTVMHAPAVTLEPTLTARQALEKFQVALRPGAAMPVSTLFVTARDGKLQRSVELRDLLAAPPDVTLAELATSVEPIKLSPLADQEEAARLFERYELSAAPVVDDDGRLIGILTTDDIIRVIQSEASEDIAKLAGTSADELQSRSVLNIVRLRMPWLIVTVAGGMLLSGVIRGFEDTLRQLIALASFTPLIAGMGGNVGTQSSTIVVRGMATGEIPPERERSTIWRECRTGMVLGLVYGLVASGAAWALYHSVMPARFPLVVGFAMWISMTVAGTMGAAVPFALKRFGTDPANATGPFITTCTDLLTNVLYLSVATVILL